jgi:hypothetical protein
MKSPDIWKNEECAKYFVQSLKESEEVAYLYRVVKKIGYRGKYPLTIMLQNKFPQYRWAASHSEKMKKSQFILKDYLNQLFTEDEGNFNSLTKIINMCQY